MTQNEIQALAKAITAALMPMLKKLKEQEPDDDESDNDASDGDGNGKISHGDVTDAVNRRVAKFGRVLRGATNFDDADGASG